MAHLCQALESGTIESGGRAYIYIYIYGKLKAVVVVLLRQSFQVVTLSLSKLCYSMRYIHLVAYKYYGTGIGIGGSTRRA